MFFDQLDLPRATPALYLVLSRASFEDGIEHLEINELIDSMLPRKSGNEFPFMRFHAPGEIVGDADIQRSVPLAR
jgi:hypothetical protein